MLHDYASAPTFCAHPWVHKRDSFDARIAEGIEKDSAGRFAFAEQYNLVNLGLSCDQRVNRGAYVRLRMFEALVLAAAVTHAAHVESQHRKSSIGELACERHKLAMRTGAILRTARDHDHNCASGTAANRMQDAEEPLVLAFENHWMLAC